MLKVKGLNKTFNTPAGRLVILNNLDLEVPDGVFVAILGKSGSGKSTLLSMLGALDAPTEGSIEIDGKDIAHASDADLIKIRRQKIGFIFQNYNLIPNLTAIGNVELALEINGIPRSKRKEQARNLLKIVGLEEGRFNSRATKLSGGEQQRVAIARALSNNPSIILADEPTGNLDATTGDAIVKLLKDLCKKHNHTVICVTHDPDIVHIADQVYHLVDKKLSKSK
jgi:putative ABC transport system ATP-binding protein